MRPKRERSPEDEVEIADLCPSCLAICHTRDMRMPFTCEHKICKECCPRLSPPKCPLCRAQSVFALTAAVAARPAAAVAAPPARPPGVNQVELTRQIFALTAAAAARPEAAVAAPPARPPQVDQVAHTAGSPWGPPPIRPPRVWHIMFVFRIENRWWPPHEGDMNEDVAFDQGWINPDEPMAWALRRKVQDYTAYPIRIIPVTHGGDVYCHFSGNVRLTNGAPIWHNLSTNLDDLSTFEAVNWTDWIDDHANSFRNRKVVVFSSGQPCTPLTTRQLVHLGDVELMAQPQAGGGDDDDDDE